MDMKSQSAIHFNQYLALLQVFSAAVKGLVAYDAETSCVWSSDVGQLDHELLKSHIVEHRSKFYETAEKESLRCLGEDSYLELIDLNNADGVIVLTLGLYLSGHKGAAPELLGKQQNVRLLSKFLVTEYEQSIALANQEDELNFMTDELTRRYEELNLIYRAEDQALNIFHGRELLRQLVANTSRFLNVDFTYLFLPGKNISNYKFKNDQPVDGFKKMVAYLRDSIYPKLQAENNAIVLNHNDDAKRVGIRQDLPFKAVVCAVVNAENEVIGALAIAGQNAVVDFTNSDRNLVDVMAHKASKIAQTNFDPLTGLENSNSFEVIIKSFLKQSCATGVQHAIVNVDIDRMAVINDISGRDAGDLLIKKVGQKLADMVRSRDVVARIGSDKFGMLLENSDLAEARIIMEKISSEVSKIDLESEGETHEVSISVGIAPVNADSGSVTSLLNAAETARNVSKEHGRNNIHVFETDDSDLLYRKEQIQWVGRIQSALRNNLFRLYAQLIQPMNPEINHPHYEILLRLKQEDGTIVPPGKFLPAAENFYLMSNIDRWVINQAFSQLARYLHGSSLPGCQISINLSGQSLADPLNMASYVRQKLEEYKLAGKAICFEITESAAIANIADARLFIDQLSALGCTFSLDDFGTGLSSFAYLKNLQVSYLKIDGSFVHDIVSDPVSESIVSAINQVGHAMNLKTIAEFVETNEIDRMLAGIGVDFSQGYCRGEPALFSEQLYNKLNSSDSG